MFAERQITNKYQIWVITWTDAFYFKQVYCSTFWVRGAPKLKILRHNIEQYIKLLSNFNLAELYPKVHPDKDIKLPILKQQENLNQLKDCRYNSFKFSWVGDKQNNANLRNEIIPSSLNSWSNCSLKDIANSNLPGPASNKKTQGSK